MAGSNNEVRVTLGLDTTPAENKLKGFFNQVKQQGDQVKDPFTKLDAGFKRVSEQASKLGFEWDAATKKFKNDGGFTQTVTQMKTTLSNLGGQTKTSGKNFDDLAARIKGASDSWKFITDGARQYGVKMNEADAASKKSGEALKKLGLDAKDTGTKAKELGGAADNLKTKLSALKGDTGLPKVGTDAKNASGSVKQLGTDTNTLSGTLKGLKGDTGLAKVGSDANAASAPTKALGTNIKTLGGDLKAVGSSSSQLKPIGDTMQTISQRATTTSTGVGTVAAKLREVGNAKSSLSPIPTSFNSVGTAAKKASDETGKLKGTFQQTGTEARNFGSVVKSSFEGILQGIPQGIGLAIGNFLIQPLKELGQVAPRAIEEFSKLDETIQLTLGIVGESSSKFGQLQSSILAVSSATAASAQEVGLVAQALSRAGFSLEEIDAALEGVVKGAEATGTSYEEMGKIVVSALGAFGLEASKAADVADVLTVAANGANTDVTQLGDAFKYVSPIAAAVGQELDETALQLQVLANSGIQASTAGTSLRTILTNLQIAAGGAGEEFTSLSRGSGRLEKAIALIGAELTDTNGDLKTGKELVNALSAAMTDLDPGERAIISKVLAGSEGLPALNALISASGEELDAFADALDNRAGVAAKTADQALSGLSGSFKILESNVSAALIEIGAVIATFLKPIIDIVTGIISALNGLPGPIKSVLVSMGLLGAAIGAVSVTLTTLKGTIVATFAGQALASIKSFVTALTAANIQNSIAGMVTSVKTLSTALKVNLAKSLTQGIELLKGFATAVKSGAAVNAFTGFVKALGNGFKGISTAGKATQLTLDFGTAAAKAGTGVAGVSKALPGMASALVGAGTAAGTAATGTAAAGAASAAATPAVAGLGASLGALLVTIAPIALAVGGVVLAFAGLKDRLDAYKDIVDPLQSSQNILTENLKKTGDQAETTSTSYRSWGKAIEDALGPLDRFLGAIMPVYNAVKLLAEGLGRLNEWDRANQQVFAATLEHQKFANALDETNARIEENRQRMSQLNPESEEFGRLAAENQTLIQGEKAALEDRIKAIDGQIAKLKENESANGRQIAALEKMKSEYQALQPVVEVNTKLIREEEKAHEDASGKVKNFTQAMAEAKIAREQAYAAADTKVLQTELKALSDLKQGLISEAEQRAINAQAAAEASNEKIAAVEQEVAELNALYAEGGLTQDQYKKAVADATKDIQGELKAREEAEIAAQKATAAAIDAALQEYNKLVTTIGQNVQTVNNMLGNLGQVSGAGISAFKGLAQAVTDFRIQESDKVRENEYKNIENTYGRQKAALEALGKDTSAIDKKIERAKEDADNKAAARRKRIVQEQVDFEAEAIKQTAEQKALELELWYQQAELSRQIARTQAEAAVLSAQANGASPEQIAALQKVVTLYDQQGEFLKTQRGLKEKINEIEDLTAKQQLNTKAAAEGVTSEFGNQVTSIDAVKRGMLEFQGEVSNAREKLETVGQGLDPIPDRAAEVAQGVKDRIEQGVAGTSFQAVYDNLVNNLNLSPEVARQQAQVIVSAYSDAGIDAGNAAATNIGERFGRDGVIPKEFVQQQLIDAMVQGADISVAEAKQRFDNNFPDAIPVERVSAVLGNAIGGGVEEGYQQLRSIPLPDGVFTALGTQVTDTVSTSSQTAKQQLVNSMTAAGSESGAGFGTNFDQQYQNITTKSAQNLNENFVSAGVSAGIETGAKFSAELATGVDSGVSLAKGPLENLGAIGRLAASTLNPAFGAAFAAIEIGAEQLGLKGGDKIESGFIQSTANVGGEVSGNISQGLLNGLTGNIVPTLQKYEAQFGVFGKTAAALFGEENSRKLGEFLKPIGDLITNAFGDASQGIKRAGEESARGFTTELGNIIPFADENARTIGQKYADIIPKEEIAEELKFALGDGTLQGTRRAEEALAKLPDGIPREEVARILADSLGVGVEDGERYLNDFVLPPGVQSALSSDVSEGLAGGGDEGARAVETSVRNSNIAGATAEGLRSGLQGGLSGLNAEVSSATAGLPQVFNTVGTNAGQSLVQGISAQTQNIDQEFSRLFDSINFDKVGQNLQKGLTEPIQKAGTALGGLSLGPEVVSQVKTISQDVNTIASSRFSSEFDQAQSQASRLAQYSNTARSSSAQLASNWARIRAEAERAARAAQSVGTSRWTGGPVQGGKAYTVNELGKEMFLSNTGTLSEIKAPAYGKWRAPTSGTVVPANISAQIRENYAAAKSDRSMAMIQNAGPTAARPSMAQQSSAFEGALLREISKLNSSNQAPVTNNVSITSSTPVSDAARVMSDLARLRALRRR